MGSGAYGASKYNRGAQDREADRSRSPPHTGEEGQGSPAGGSPMNSPRGSPMGSPAGSGGEMPGKTSAYARSGRTYSRSGTALAGAASPTGGASPKASKYSRQRSNVEEAAPENTAAEPAETKDDTP